VGEGKKKDRELIALTERALAAGIDAAIVGNRIGDISFAIGEVARKAGIAVNTDFGGHGVGRVMHGEPHVPNAGQPKKGPLLKAGLVIAIEPWFMRGTSKLRIDPDGWTLRSADGSRTAHSEHTIAVTTDGPIVLTQR
jgi:methionyl aminopeptidase